MSQEVQKELKEATKTLTKLVTLQPEEPEYPKRTPKWFKEYININSIGKAMGVTLLAAIITGMGAFGGFPTPPKLFIQLFNIPGFRWFAVFLLIWQGAGGGAEFTWRSLGMSFMSTLVIWLIYQFPLVKYGYPEPEISDENDEIDEDEVNIAKKTIEIAMKKEKIVEKPPKQELVNIYNEKHLSPIDIENQHLKALKYYTDSLENEMNKTIELKDSTPKYDQQWKSLPKVQGSYKNNKYNSLKVYNNAIENSDLVSEKPENLYNDNTPYQEHNDFWVKEN